MVGVGLLLPQRKRLSFRSVNRRDAIDYEPGLNRHHILPRQLLTIRSFPPMLSALGKERLCFEDFRRNGLLLPANDDSAIRVGLPLHRGPHHHYNAMVSERVGQIEAGWSSARLRAPEVAMIEAYQRLQLLQIALRRRLLAQHRRFKLNRKDPLGSGVDFTQLDAMAEALWAASDLA